MPAFLKALLTIVVAGLTSLTTLGTVASLGHAHAAAGPAAPPARPASAGADAGEIPGWLVADIAAPTPPAPQPTAEPVAQPAAAQPAPPAPARPAVSVVSAQQSLINADRAAAGLPPLAWSPCLSAVAAGQSAAMVAQGRIFHGSGVNQDFGCGLGSRQTGENVGYWSRGVNDGQLNTMFMNSPEHRANILGPYQYVGTAWLVAPNGYGYISVEFG